MKVNIVPTIIAAAISALLAYALYALCKTEGQEWLIALGGFVCFFLSLGAGIAVRFEQGRTSANAAVLGWVFFFILLISQGIFAFTQFSTPAYIIINGVLLLTFVGITYAVANAKQ